MKKKQNDKFKKLEIELVKCKNINNPTKLKSELKELNKKHFVDLNFHENKNDTSRDYTGEFGMVGSLVDGDQIRQTHFTFRIITDYEHYTNSIEQGYDSDDSIFTGYIYIFNTV